MRDADTCEVSSSLGGASGGFGSFFFGGSSGSGSSDRFDG